MIMFSCNNEIVGLIPTCLFHHYLRQTNKGPGKILSPTIASCSNLLSVWLLKEICSFNLLFNEKLERVFKGAFENLPNSN